MIFKGNRIVINIPALLKQSRPANSEVVITLKLYIHDASLCVVDAFKTCVTRTRGIRGAYKQLLISFQKPHHPVTKATIARWIKLVLYEAGMDVCFFLLIAPELLLSLLRGELMYLLKISLKLQAGQMIQCSENFTGKIFRKQSPSLGLLKSLIVTSSPKMSKI